MKEKTISAPVFFKGTGLHTGMKTEMTVCPAPERSGIRFQRTDLPGCPFLEAVADNVVQTERSTVLLKDRVSVHTSEHLMAAFYGLDIHNALVQLNGPEVPILDGSAYPFARAFTDIGIQEQHACVRYGHLSSALQFSDPDTGTLIEITPSETYSARVIIDFQSEVLGRQEYVYSPGTDFKEEVAPSRTFVLLHENLFLYKNGLASRGDLNNALVIAEKEIETEDQKLLQHIFASPAVHIHKGYLNTSGPRFPNECARHKMVDLLGDLMLVGKRFHATVTAFKPGHAANTAVARMIRNQLIMN